MMVSKQLQNVYFYVNYLQNKTNPSMHCNKDRHSEIRPGPFYLVLSLRKHNKKRVKYYQ